MSQWKATYTNALGASVPFDDPTNGVHQNDIILDTGMPAPVYTSEPVFDLPGETLVQTRIGVRDISIPIAVRAGDGITLRERSRAMAARLSPLLGDGTLRIDRVGAASRSIKCRYLSGFEGLLEPTDWGPMWQEAIIVFRCFDPFWRDADPTVLTFGPSGDSAIPFFPIAASPTDFGPHFGSSSVFQDFDIQNLGDGEAPPIWRINGPITAPRLLNFSTGFALDLSNDGGLNLIDGQYLDIDTNPARPSVRLFDGTNGFHFLTTGSALWPLAIGDNHMSVQSGGAAPGTRISMSYQFRYLHI